MPKGTLLPVELVYKGNAVRLKTAKQNTGNKLVKEKRHGLINQSRGFESPTRRYLREASPLPRGGQGLSVLTESLSSGKYDRQVVDSLV